MCQPYASALLTKCTAPITTGTATSVTVGTGTKTFTGVGSGLGYQTGMAVRAYDTATTGSTAVMFGNIISYSGTTMVVNVLGTLGSGNIIGWTIQSAGEYKYNGRLLGTMLFPNNTDVTGRIDLCMTGGPGHEFDDNTGTRNTTGVGCSADGTTSAGTYGTNQNGCQGPAGQTHCGNFSNGNFGFGGTPDHLNPVAFSGVVEPGSWRIEESPGSAAKTDYFLNVLSVGDNNTGVFPTSVTGSTSGSGVTATHTGTATFTGCTITAAFNDLGSGVTVHAAGGSCAATF